MLYPLLKALHIAAVLGWIGGLTAALLVIRAHHAGSLPQVALTVAFRWDRRIANPAQGLVWLLGLTLAWQGDWFSAPWLWVKLALIIALGALHGRASATLRKLATGSAVDIPDALVRVMPAVLMAVTLIALLVVLKPFG